MRCASRLALMVLSLAGAWGCGGAPIAPGKAPAAEALFYVSKGYVTAYLGGPDNFSGAPLAPLASALSFAAVYDCPVDGVIDYACDTGGSSAQTDAFNMTFKRCRYDNRYTISGGVHYAVSRDPTAPTLAAMAMRGAVTFDGEIADAIEFDATQTVDLTALWVRSGTVTVTLDGFIEDSSGRYDFASEAISIPARGIDHE